MPTVTNTVSATSRRIDQRFMTLNARTKVCRKQFLAAWNTETAELAQ
jgi:hypothetical protein